MQIGELLKNYKVETLKPRGRRELIKELYDLYTQKIEVEARKKENWRRYVAYLKEYRIPGGKEKRTHDEWVGLSKKRKIAPQLRFVEPFTDKVFAIKLNMCVPKGDERTLYWLISNAKDMHNRGSPFAPWMFAIMK